MTFSTDGGRGGAYTSTRSSDKNPTCISGLSHLWKCLWNTPLQKPEGLRMTNVYPKNLWLDQGLRGCHVSEGKRAGLSGWKYQEMEGSEERRGGQQTNVRLPRQGDRVAEWVGFDRHVSHRLTAPSIAPGWPPWLTASRWRMNGVVRPTVSQSHIAVVTRPRLNRHTAAQGDLWVRRQTFGTEG